jgi:membrane protein implicated in regulation of membrane protease activity
MEASSSLVWVLIGISLVVLEIFTGTFYLLFVGFAALIMAALVFTVGPLGGALEGTLFALLSLGVAWFVKIKKIHQSRTSSFQIDEKAVFISSEDLDPGQTKNVFYQGVPWSARNISLEAIRKGQLVRIVETQSIRLLIEPQKDGGAGLSAIQSEAPKTHLKLEEK